MTSKAFERIKAGLMDALDGNYEMRPLVLFPGQAKRLLGSDELVPEPRRIPDHLMPYSYGFTHYIVVPGKVPMK